MLVYITNDKEIYLDDSDKENSGEQNSNDENLMKKIKYRMFLIFIFSIPPYILR